MFSIQKCCRCWSANVSMWLPNSEISWTLWQTMASSSWLRRKAASPPTGSELVRLELDWAVQILRLVWWLWETGKCWSFWFFGLNFPHVFPNYRWSRKRNISAEQAGILHRLWSGSSHQVYTLGFSLSFLSFLFFKSYCFVHSISSWHKHSNQKLILLLKYFIKNWICNKL